MPAEGFIITTRRHYHSQPFGETAKLGAHLPYSATSLQRLELRQSRDALLQCVRETSKDF